MSGDSRPGWRDRWRGLRAELLAPRADPTRLAEALQAARARQGLPVVWLLGKTQSGKTSIIRALTGHPQALVGDGFRACTTRTCLYDYPAEAPVVRFLDTRGLGEVDYDPGEDLRFAESRSQLLLAVMKVTDPDQAAVIETLRAVRARHPDWPLIVAQTCLHEAYPFQAEHPQPYPFAEDANWPLAVAPDLARLLQAQRDRCGTLPGSAPIRWVAIDLTLPEDGYAPADYGLEALWSSIDAVWSTRLHELLHSDSAVRDVLAQAAHPHILGYAMGAAGVGAVPVSLTDWVGVPAIQAKLLQSLAAIHGLEWDRQTRLEFLGLLGTGIGVSYLARGLGRGLLKLVPVVGWGLGAVWGAAASGATTYALGKAAVYYFGRRARGMATDPERLREVYGTELKRGQALLMDLTRSGSGSGSAP